MLIDLVNKKEHLELSDVYFIEAHKMVLWRIQEGDYKGKLVEVNQGLTDPQELEVIGDSVLVLSAAELIQCLLYPDLDMETFAEIPLEKGTVLLKKRVPILNI